MINISLVVVLVLSVSNKASNLVLISLSVLMLMCYSKWNSHFSMVLINLEFFTLIILFMIFYLSSRLQLEVPMMMMMITSLVVEACLGLSLLVLIVRTKKNETLMSALA